MAIRGDLTHHAPPWWTKVQQNKMLTESKEKEREREREGERERGRMATSYI